MLEEEVIGTGHFPLVQSLFHHPVGEAKRHGGDFIHDHGTGIMHAKDFLGPAANPNGEHNSDKRAPKESPK